MSIEIIYNAVKNLNDALRPIQEDKLETTESIISFVKLVSAADKIVSNLSVFLLPNVNKIITQDFTRILGSPLKQADFEKNEELFFTVVIEVLKKIEVNGKSSLLLAKAIVDAFIPLEAELQKEQPTLFDGGLARLLPKKKKEYYMELLKKNIDVISHFRSQIAYYNIKESLPERNNEFKCLTEKLDSLERSLINLNDIQDVTAALANINGLMLSMASYDKSFAAFQPNIANLKDYLTIDGASELINETDALEEKIIKFKSNLLENKKRLEAIKSSTINGRRDIIKNSIIQVNQLKERIAKCQKENNDTIKQIEKSDRDHLKAINQSEAPKKTALEIKPPKKNFFQKIIKSKKKAVVPIEIQASPDLPNLRTLEFKLRLGVGKNIQKKLKLDYDVLVSNIKNDLMREQKDLDDKVMQIEAAVESAVEDCKNARTALEQLACTPNEDIGNQDFWSSYNAANELYEKASMGIAIKREALAVVKSDIECLDSIVKFPDLSYEDIKDRIKKIEIIKLPANLKDVNAKLTSLVERRQYANQQKNKLLEYMENRNANYKFRDSISKFSCGLFGFESEKNSRAAFINNKLLPALESYVQTGDSNELNDIIEQGIKKFLPRCSAKKADFHKTLRCRLLELQESLASAVAAKALVIYKSPIK